MKENNKGISLIVLIVTIIVIIILAAVVVLTLNKNNPIESAKEAAFKEDVQAYQSELNMYIGEEFAEKLGKRKTKITALEYGEAGDKNSVYTYISKFKKKYENKLAIKDDLIVYVGSDEKEREWTKSIGLDVSIALTIEYIDENGNKLKDDTKMNLTQNSYTVDVPQIDGYITLEDKLSGVVNEDTTISVEYYKINTDLAFTGLNSSGAETTTESQIVAYTVSGIGGCTSKKLAIPEKYNDKPVTKIKQKAFQNNKNITSVIIRDNIKTIEYYAFASCTNLKDAYVDAESIGMSTFRWCSNLKKIVFGENVAKIATSILANCDNLDDVTVLSEKFMLSNNTLGALTTSSLKEIKISEDNSKYMAKDGAIYSKDEKTLYIIPPGQEIERYVTPSYLSIISDRAVAWCLNLKYVEITSNISYVQLGAFAYCKNLEEAVVHKCSMGAQVFYECTNLKSVTLDSGVVLGAKDFSGCKNLTSLKYLGTTDEWKGIKHNTSWNEGSSITKIECSNGTITI